MLRSALLLLVGKRWFFFFVVSSISRQHRKVLLHIHSKVIKVQVPSPFLLTFLPTKGCFYFLRLEAKLSPYIWGINSWQHTWVVLYLLLLYLFVDLRTGPLESITLFFLSLQEAILISLAALKPRIELASCQAKDS